MAKLLGVSVYGKTLQRTPATKTAICYNAEDISRYSNIKDIWCWDKFCYVTYSGTTAIRKPAYLGAFILSYGRAMINDFISRFGGHSDIEKMPFYSDTDSVIFNANQLSKIEDLLATT